MSQTTTQIINQASTVVSQAQKNYISSGGKVNIAELKRNLTKIVDGYSKAHIRIMNEMDITEPAIKQKKKQFVKQYLKENLNKNLITSCQKTKNPVDEKFSKEILQILKENFSKPFFVCTETGEIPVKGLSKPQQKKGQSMKQRVKRIAGSGLSSVAGAVGGLSGAVGGLLKKKEKPAVNNPQQAKKQSYGQKIKRKVKQVGGKVSSGISSGYSKVASMIPKKDVCNEQEALMLIRLLQANKKNQLGNFVFKDGEKKIALQGLQKKIKAEGIDSQIKEMYISIKQNIQKQVKQ